MEIKEFGGLNTQLDPTNLPIFMSPNCYNVEFIPRTVKSRQGFTTVLQGSVVADSINYIKSYVLPSGDVRTLFNDNIGNLFYEDATADPGNEHIISQSLLPDTFPNSVTMFGKEWIAMGDGKEGYGPPFKYNGADGSYNRISQDGPGASPYVTDLVSVLVVSALNMASFTNKNALSLTEIGNIVTANIQIGYDALQIAVGDQIRITGAGVAGYN